MLVGTYAVAVAESEKFCDADCVYQVLGTHGGGHLSFDSTGVDRRMTSVSFIGVGARETKKNEVPTDVSPISLL